MVTAVRSRDVDRPVLVLVPDLQGVECPQEGVAVGWLDPVHVLVHDLHRRPEVVAIQLAAICCLRVGHEIVDHRAAVDPDRHCRLLHIKRNPLQPAADRGHAAGYRVGGLHCHAGHSPGGTGYPGGDAGPGGTGLPSRLCG